MVGCCVSGCWLTAAARVEACGVSGVCALHMQWLWCGLLSLYKCVCCCLGHAIFILDIMFLCFICCVCV